MKLIATPSQTLLSQSPSAQGFRAFQQPAKSLAILTQELATVPLHGARSFSLSAALQPGSLSQKGMLLPKTGIQEVDGANKSITDVVRLTRKSFSDLPKAAIHGGLYGTAVGGVIGLIQWAIHESPKLVKGRAHEAFRFKPLFIVSLFPLAGGALGSLFCLAQECYRKFKAFKKALF